MAKYMSGARCTIKINDRLAGFAFGVSWNIETDVTPIRTIDNYLPHELAPRQIRVTGTLSGFRVPGESVDSKSIQSNVVNFLINKYISIEVRDSQSDNRIFQTQKAIVTGRHERIEAGKLMETELTWEAIGWIDEKSPKPPSPPSGKIEAQVEKDLDKLAGLIDPEEIDEEIDLYDWEPSKENRIQLIKEWLARLQEKFELPFVLDEKDYSQIHDLLYQTSGTGKNSSNNS